MKQTNFAVAAATITMTTGKHHKTNRTVYKESVPEFWTIRKFYP